ncbi:hypothetical protein BDF14DRAFT_1859203 [Spinellus fusiger]|nr:hypothetical protein BDF14DRAFT_1859203 [Spinellus fusiger]
MADESGEVTSHNNLGAACFRCRGFRHACERQRPTCSRCLRRGIHCTYPEAAPTLKKLQKATETLGERIRKFSEKLKSTEGLPKDLKSTSLKRMTQQTCVSAGSSKTPSITTETSDSQSTASATSETTYEWDEGMRPRLNVASISSFSVYPCNKCFKDLQQCDLTMPRCGRCKYNNTDCFYTRTEPKANNVSQVLNTMNKVMDQWQESIDKMAKDLAQKTRDFSARANNSLKMKPLQPFVWKITSTGKGLSVESDLNSYNDFSRFVDQFMKAMHIAPREVTTPTPPSSVLSEERQKLARELELDDKSSIQTSSGFSFAVWSTWSNPTNTFPQDYPIDITPELTDDLIRLYFQTPCCSALRMPIVDTTGFMERYQHPDPTQRPSTILIYAICSMAARNAFQLHVWSKRPSHESPHYNMGKALSIAYSIKGRELLSECFDEPSIDNCQAAFLLSYSSHQNGNTGVIYIYEWIAFTMAQEMGYYDSSNELTRQQSIIVWCLYYYNTWYRVLQGNTHTDSIKSNQFYPHCPLPPPPPKPILDTTSGSSEAAFREETIDHYVWSTWNYLIKLQKIRHDAIARILAAQTLGKPDTDLPLDLMEMHDRLQEFYDSLPDEWQSPEIELLVVDMTKRSMETPPMESGHTFCYLELTELAQACIFEVNIHYHINKILLNQPFFPSDHMPTNAFSLHCLKASVDSAYFITHAIEGLVKCHNDCYTPVAGLLFSNLVYSKLLNYQDVQYREFALQSMQLSLVVAKQSNGYTYDFDRVKRLVQVIEQEICANSSILIDQQTSMGTIGFLSALPSPPHHPSFNHSSK